MDYTLDDFLSETLYELSSCIIQRDYPIDVFRKKLESAISKGFQINYRDDDAGVIGYPLLIRAIWGPYPTGEEIVKVLIEHGADPNIAEYPNGEHALDEAIRVGSTIELIEFIIDSGADVNLQDKLGCTAFSEAALSYIYENPDENMSCGIDVVKLLLGRSADPYLCNYWTCQREYDTPQSNARRNEIKKLCAEYLAGHSTCYA